jgi:hypothetical protein
MASRGSGSGGRGSPQVHDEPAVGELARVSRDVVRTIGTRASGGGSGGSFGSSGGGGGADDGGYPRGVPSRPVIPTALRGGCAGEAGLDGGGAAVGGGAVALLVVTSIQIDGVINASDGGGGGSMNNNR